MQSNEYKPSLAKTKLSQKLGAREMRRQPYRSTPRMLCESGHSETCSTD
jgi:hypothetical protein